MTIAIDFDGTCVAHAYPEIGNDIGAVPVLQKLAKHNKLILWTMRDGEGLKDAIRWFRNNDIPLHGIQENPDWKTGSPKAYANMYIDDAALGCPLLFDEKISDRPFANWEKIDRLIMENGSIKLPDLMGNVTQHSPG